MPKHIIIPKQEYWFCDRYPWGCSIKHESKEEAIECAKKKNDSYIDKNKEELKSYWDSKQQPCVHDRCSSCHGTGVKQDGSACIHMISCNCPRCLQ